MLELRRLHPRVRAALERKRNLKQFGGFYPTQISAVSAWLRLAGGTVAGLGYSSVPDVLASNPATQATDARRPTNQTSNNSLPIATCVHTTPQPLVWPTSAGMNATAKWGFACWLRINAGLSGARVILGHGGSTGAYDNMKCEIYSNISRGATVMFFGPDSAGYNGRQGVAAANTFPATGTWFFLRAAFDGSQGTEATRHRLLVNEVDISLTYSNVGTGGAPVALRSSAVPAIFGNYSNDADTTLALNGSYGPNIYMLSDALTAAQGLALMNFEAPT